MQWLVQELANKYITRTSSVLNQSTCSVHLHVYTFLQISTSAHHLTLITVNKHALTQKVAIPVIAMLGSFLVPMECLVQVSSAQLDCTVKYTGNIYIQCSCV